MFKKIVFISTLLFLVCTNAWADVQERMEQLEAMPFKRLHGPNCWNSALYLNGLAKSVRFSSSQEFQTLMESPYCHTLKDPEVGSIKVYRVNIPQVRGAKREVHAAVWLSAHHVFNKMTAFSTSSYQIETHEAVDANYGRLPTIVRIPITDEVGRFTEASCSDEDCKNQILYKSCYSLSVIEQDITRADFNNIYQEIAKIETEVAAELFRDSSLLDSFIEGHLDALDGLEQQLFLLTPASELEHWQVDYLTSVIASLKEQLTMKQPNWLD